MSRLPRFKQASPKAVFEVRNTEDLHPTILKQARKSGQLNLSNRGFVAVPDKVWHISEISPEESKTLTHSWDTPEDERWWDVVNLTKLNLSSNRISDISPKISNLDALQVLNLRDNMITALPDEIMQLKFLQHVNLSRNRLIELPDGFYSLKDLRFLDISHNCFCNVHCDIGNLSQLEDLNISDNQLVRLPPAISFLSRVTSLNLSNNQLKELPLEIGGMMALRMLDLSHNKLTCLPSALGELCHLLQLYLHHNCLVELPLLHNCTELQEIHLGYNVLTQLDGERLLPLLKLKLLDLRDNKIPSLPEEIILLQALERLDLANNYLNNLPYMISTLPHIKLLVLDGNPLRSIRRDILQRGTVHLLKFLRSRIEPDSPEIVASNDTKVEMSRLKRQSTGDAKPEIDIFSLKKSQCFEFSNRKALEIPEEFFKIASEAGVTVINLSRNQLADIPESISLALPRVTELHFSSNRLSSITNSIGLARHLSFLDLSSNRFMCLPDTIADLENLREIWLSSNRFTQLPQCLYHLTKLEIILASDNGIDGVDVAGLSRLSKLATLNLQNNNISSIPPELGNLTQLRSVLLEGNPFRHPRPAILTKGTPYLLEYLRDRIPK